MITVICLLMENKSTSLKLIRKMLFFPTQCCLKRIFRGFRTFDSREASLRKNVYISVD